MSNKAEKLWMSDIADLGCVVCRNEGFGNSPAEVHHLKTGCGMSQRSKDMHSIPLCPTHHRAGVGDYGVAFHAGPKVWQEKFGTELDLLAQTIEDVNAYRANTIGRAA
jgi:hypothetical protein